VVLAAAVGAFAEPLYDVADRQIQFVINRWLVLV
jgi:hypothetical protein